MRLTGPLSRKGLAGSVLATLTASAVLGTASAATAAPAPGDPGRSLVPGQVFGWGDSGRGQLDTPAEARSGVGAIAAGDGFTLALKDGKVIGWGKDAYGAHDVPPAAQYGVSLISAGKHVLAVKNGGVLAWGNNAEQQSRVPETATSGVSAVSAGGSHSLAVKNGGVLAWGGNGSQQITVPSTAQFGVKAVAAGGTHSLALKENGEVLAWGYDNYGQTDVPAAAKSGVKAVVAGDAFSAALKDDGSVVLWGQYGSSELYVPQGATSGVKAIAAGAAHMLALKTDGSVLAWGKNTKGETVVPGEARSGVSAVAAGTATSVALHGGSVEVGAPVIKTPAPNATVDGPEVHFEGTADHANGVREVELVDTTDGNRVIGTYGVGANGQWWTPDAELPGGFAPGKHTVKATGILADGGRTPSSSVSFTVRPHAAVPVITTPSKDASVTGPKVKFDGTADYANGIRSVKLVDTSAGDRVIGTYGVSAKGQWWTPEGNPPGGFAPGKHTVKAIGLFADGKEATSSTVTFTVLPSAAAPVIRTPSKDATVTGPTVKFDGTADYANGVRTVKLSDAKDNRLIAEVSVGADGQWWTPQDKLPSLPPGTYTVKVVGVLGNGTETGPASVSFTVLSDAAAPVIRTPVAGTTVSGPQVKFDGTADYGHGVRWLRLLDADDHDRVIAEVGVGANGEWWTPDGQLPTLSAGTHTVKAVGVLAGNQGQTAPTTVTFTVR